MFGKRVVFFADNAEFVRLGCYMCRVFICLRRYVCRVL